MTKPSQHQWPTNGATRAYVDRVGDRLTARVDRLVEKNRVLTKELGDLGRLVRAFIGDQVD